MTKKLLKNKFILELNEEVTSAQVSEMEDDSTHTDMVLDDEEEDEEEEEDERNLSTSSSVNSSTSPPLTSDRLIHSGSHHLPSSSEELNNSSNNKDFLLFRKMASEAAAAAAAVASATASTTTPVVPMPLRQSDFLLPSSSSFKSSFHPRFSDDHWKALTSLYSNSSSHYYLPSPNPFLVGKLSPLFNPSFPSIEDRLGSLAAFSSSPFQPLPPVRSFHPPSSSHEFRSHHHPLWSFDPLKRKQSSSPSPPVNKDSLRKRESESGMPSLALGDKRFSVSSIEPSRPVSPPAMKRYKRERLVLPSSCTLSKDQIIHMPIDQFNDYLARSNFTEEELSRLKDARRKGKNRVAARRSRDHRLQEVKSLKSRQERVKKEKIHVFKEYETSIEDCKLWERIHELFQYHIQRYVDSQNGFKAPPPELMSSSGQPSPSSIVPSRAFNPPPLVLNSC